MKHTFKRAMSLFMALAMVLTMVPSFGTHVHAEELETEPVVMTEEPATEAPVVEAPETEAAETEAPTQAPETEAPATEAPEIVETEAPEVTEEAPEVVETEPAEETEAIEETFPEEILEEEIVEEEAVAKMLTPPEDDAVQLVSLFDQSLTVYRYGKYNKSGDSVTDGTADWAYADEALTCALHGYKKGAVNNPVYSQILFKNTSGASATLEFTWELANGSVESSDAKIVVADATKTPTGQYATVLEAGASVIIQVGSPKGNNGATFTIKYLDFYGEDNSDVTLNFAVPEEGGSYTVNGETVAVEKSFTVARKTQFALAATPEEGYQFYGWYDYTNDVFLSYAAETTLTAKGNVTVSARFVPETTAMFGVGIAKFDDLTEAGEEAAAGSVKTIVLLNNGVLSGAHTIPAGVTLLIPFDDVNTVYADTPAFVSSLNEQWTQPTAYRTLKMAADAAITVNGAISVGGKHFAGGSGSNAGSPTGNVGFVNMEKGSKITLNSGANLYAWGYITGSGTITAKSGAKVYENFQVRDFRGGNATLMMAAPSEDPETGINPKSCGVFPLSQYYVQNIETEITFEAGAEEHVYTSLTASSTSLGAGVPFIGSTGMFQPQAGCSLSKKYDGSRDRLIVEVNGDALMASIAMSVAGNSIDSSEFVLPIGGNIDIRINSGTTTLKQDTAMLPGSTLSVAKGATLTIQNQNDNLPVDTYYMGKNNLFIYDADEWNYGYLLLDYINADGDLSAISKVANPNYVYGSKQFIPLTYAPGRTYNRTTADLKDVKIDVNGVLIAEGYLYTTAGGANITSSGKSGKIVLQSGAGEDTVTYQFGQVNTDVIPYVIPIASAQLRNGNGSYLDTTGAEPGATFNYCAPCDAWHASDYVHAAVEITWANLGFAADVTEEYNIGAAPEYKGATPTKATANCKAYTFAGWKDQDGKEYPIGTDLPDATTDATYFAYFTESDAHSFTTKRGTEITAGTCMTEAVYAVKCDNCDAENTGKTVKGEKDPTNHTKKNTYVEGAKEATCGAAGYTGDTYCECGVVIETGETIPATGNHNYVTEVSRTAATCMAEGSVTKKCACGAQITETLEIDPTNHTGKNHFENAVSETCGKDGYEGDIVCECGVKVGTGKTIPATGNHNYVTEVSRTAATCMAEGSVTKKCGCGAQITETLEIDPTNHTKQNTTVKDAVEATCGEEGYTGDTYCECGEKIADGETIPATGAHVDGDDGNHNCDVCSAPDVDGGCHGGEATCQGPAVCDECDSEYGDLDPENHASDAFTYENNGNGTHVKSHECCGVVIDEAEPCDYKMGEEEHTCACGQVEHFILTIEYIAINEDGEWLWETKEVSVPYGARLIEVEEVAGLASEIYVNASDNKGVFVRTGCSFDHPEADLEGGCVIEEETMPGSDAWLYVEYSFTGWANYGEGWVYEKDDEIQLTGWTAFDDGEGGKDWYYLDPKTGIRAEGIARVPYPSKPIMGFKYGPNEEDMANTDYNYPDATEAWFVFASGTENGENDGKFLNNYSGPANTDKALISWAVKGMIPWHVGMVQLDENVYAYFIGDEVNGGNVMATGDVYVIRVADNCERAFAIGGIYTFGENGLLIDNHGIVDMGNGTKRYYQNAQLMAGAGLVEVPIDNNDNYAFIFVRGNGELVVNTKYWVGANDLNVVPGLYAFDENGYMINPAPADKNGVFAEDGALYFYENGKRTYKGLIEYGDGIIYVTTSGKLATGKYYVTKTDLIEGYEPGFYFFDAEGYMEITTRNGIVDGKFYVDGQVQYGAGLIEYNDGMIYVKSNGQVVMDQAYWITNTNNLLPAGCYEFDSEGYLQIDESLDGVVGLNYYIDGVKQFGNGLVKVEDGYIYVKTNGELATGTYWITRTNGLMSAGCYEFDTDGYMILG